MTSERVQGRQGSAGTLTKGSCVSWSFLIILTLLKNIQEHTEGTERAIVSPVAWDSPMCSR